MTHPVDLGDLLDAYAITGRGFIVAVTSPQDPPAAWPGLRIAFNTRTGRRTATVLGEERIHSCLKPRAQNDIVYLFVTIDGIEAKDVVRDMVVHNPDTTGHFS
ncbi:hypothetical protein KIKIMORA_02960 [Brevundimonas phage vB_BpoS-Kikimora]|uniref:Uncharacterized protein n=1 Tax=Brevundimonas phage vB_BpoS-Kikimora TaxID=2948601 RepID=A0A9E7MTF6_9CAUD|nr:hypothetical protein KIKIMORA_02960 [Brevundimonas phage vB_BpoS-Kikimora]